VTPAQHRVTIRAAAQLLHHMASTQPGREQMGRSMGIPSLFVELGERLGYDRWYLELACGKRARPAPELEKLICNLVDLLDLDESGVAIAEAYEELGCAIAAKAGNR
jgi:hypothetical protein